MSGGVRTTLIGGQPFVIDPYKEPLVQLPGAIKGYQRGTLPYAASDGRLPCAMCQPLRTFDNLGRHVRVTHGLAAQEYREAIGLLPSTSLLSRREWLRYSTWARAHPVLARPGTSSLADPAIRSRSGPARTRNAVTPERLNKQGMCRDQIIAVARTIARENGGTLPMYALRRQHVWQSRLRRVGFADVKALAAEIGASALKGPIRRSDASMLEDLRLRAEELGRTPGAEELTPRMASATSYRNHFGTYAEACRRAGLPPNLPRPMAEGDEIDILNGYATGGNFEVLATHIHRSPEAVRAVLAKYGITFLPGGPEKHRREMRAFAATIARRLGGVDEEAA